MIALTRVRTTIAIRAAYRGASKNRKDKALLLAQRQFLRDPDTPIAFQTSFWKNAKVQLKSETHGKCAYCDADTDVVCHGDVEHYRPKSVYWWLAYTYDNFLFACQLCNQIYKGDNFPCAGTAFTGPQILATSTDAQIEALLTNISPDPINTLNNYRLDQYENCHRLEEPLLLNPYLDAPTNYIAYKADDILEEVEVVAANAPAEPYIKSMEDFYGINRIELKTLRHQIFRTFRAMKKMYPGLDDADPMKAEIRSIIDVMLSDKRAFAGMCRYFDSKL